MLLPVSVRNPRVQMSVAKTSARQRQWRRSAVSRAQRVMGNVQAQEDQDENFGRILQPFVRKSKTHLKCERQVDSLVEAILRSDVTAAADIRSGRVPRRVLRQTEHTHLGFTPLLAAAASNEDERRGNRCLVALLEAGVSARQLVYQGEPHCRRLEFSSKRIISTPRSALHEAVESENVGAARQLLLAGADVNQRTEEEMTPLMLALFREHRVLVQLLLGHGASVALTDRFQRSAIHLAGVWDSPPDIRHLLIEAHDRQVYGAN